MMDQFYVHLKLFYTFLAFVGLLFNWRDRGMKFATLAVWASIISPVVKTSNPGDFYLQAMVIELVALLFIMRLATGWARLPMVLLSLILLSLHAYGYNVGPQPGVGFYRAFAPLFEISQLLTCIFVSPWFINSLAMIYSERKK